MAARSLNRAVISFGLVTVPVKVYPAANPSSRIRFHLLHAKDQQRLKQQYVCTKDGAIVPQSEMVKGYEYAKNRYVVFTKEELKKLEQDPTTASIPCTSSGRTISARRRGPKSRTRSSMEALKASLARKGGGRAHGRRTAAKAAKKSRLPSTAARRAG